MREGDRVRVKPRSLYAAMLDDPETVGTVKHNDGLRLWVLFDDPPLYADAWPRTAFEPVVAGARSSMEDGCSEEG